MDNTELIHNLKVLVELDLEPKLKLMGEGTDIKNVNAARRQMVKEFINNLPPEYREIPNYQEIILSCINNLVQRRKRKEAERNRYNEGDQR